MLTLIRNSVLCCAYGDQSRSSTNVLPSVFPRQRGNVRVTNLQFLNALLYVAEHGCKWRGLPRRFGPWHTIYTRMNRSSKNGVLDQVFELLQREQTARIQNRVRQTGLHHGEGAPGRNRRFKKNGPQAMREDPVADGAARFIWLPQMLERP